MAESQDINDQKRDDRRGSVVGEMDARRETMADGRRYIVYYTFGDDTPDAGDMNTEAKAENV